MSKVKKYQYDSLKRDDAIQAVRDGMSKNATAKLYGVPRTTLNDKISGKYREGKRAGRDPFLSSEEETEIVR